MAKRDDDPQVQLRELERSLAKDPPARGYVLRGEERWFVERALGLIEQACRAAGHEVVWQDGESEEFEARSLHDDLVAVPMFAESRAIFLRRADPAIAGGKDAPMVKAMVAFLASPRPGCLVVSARSLRVDHALAKAVTAAGGRVISCRKLWDTPPPFGSPDPLRTELVQWFLARAKEKGVRIDSERALLVTRATGNDLFELDGRIEEIRTGSGGAHAGEAWTGGGSPFEAARFLADGDASQALPALAALWAGGFQDKSGKRTVDSHALIGILAGTLRRLISEASIAASAREHDGADEAGAIAAAGVSGRGRDELIARFPLRDAAGWRAMQDDLAALERRSRSGATVDVNDWMAFTLRWRVSRRGAARSGGSARGGGGDRGGTRDRATAVRGGGRR